MEITPRGGAPGVLATFGYQAGPRQGEELPVTAPVVVVGQGAPADLVLDDDSVSRQHARLEHDGGGWRLTDLGSTNGTFVEGARLAPQVATPLPDGAAVRFGGVRLHFREGAGADVGRARAEFEARPAAAAPAPPRRFRLPVWVVVLVLLVLAALALLLSGNDAPEGSPAAVEEVSPGADPPPAAGPP